MVAYGGIWWHLLGEIMILPCSPPFILQVPFTTITVGIDISRFGIPDLSKVPVSSTSTWPDLAKAFQTGHFPTNRKRLEKRPALLIIVCMTRKLAVKPNSLSARMASSGYDSTSGTLMYPDEKLVNESLPNMVSYMMIIMIDYDRL